MSRRLRYIVVCCSVLVALEARAPAEVNRAGRQRDSALSGSSLRKTLLFIRVEGFALKGPLRRNTSEAQNAGVRGTVVDENNQPLEGVQVLLEFLGGVSRELRFESDEKGTFIRVGLRMGDYRLTLQKEGFETHSEEVKLPPGSPTRLATMTLRSDTALGIIASEEAQAEYREHFDQAVAEVQAENYPAALAAFEQILELQPDSAAAYLNIGVVYAQMGESDKAVENLRKAVEIRPDYYEAYVVTGRIHGAEGRWPETMEVLGKALEVQPDATDTLFDYGAAASNAQEFAKAKEAFEKLLAVDPEHAGGHYQMGMIYVNQGENDAAILHLEKYLELEPEGPQATTATGVLDHLKK